MTINLKIPASWRTALVGVLSVFYAAMNAYGDGSLQMAIHDPKVQIAVLVALLGILAKDSQVTGGTTGQPSTPEAMKTANQQPSAEHPPA